MRRDGRRKETGEIGAKVEVEEIKIVESERDERREMMIVRLVKEQKKEIMKRKDNLKGRRKRICKD